MYHNLGCAKPKKLKPKVGFPWHFEKPKLNSQKFSNVCLVMESLSWSTSTLQMVMFTTVYDWWPAGNIVRFQINRTSKPVFHEESGFNHKFFLFCGTSADTNSMKTMMDHMDIYYSHKFDSSICKINWTEPQVLTKPNRNWNAFFKTETKVQKSIPHIPNYNHGLQSLPIIYKDIYTYIYIFLRWLDRNFFSACLRLATFNSMATPNFFFLAAASG